MCFGALFRSNATLRNFFTSGHPISLDNIDHHVLLVVNGTVTPPDHVKFHCPAKSENVIDFKVSRPFLFYIMDMETRVPYFSGLVKNLTGKGVVSHSDEFESDKKFNKTEDCKQVYQPHLI